MTDLKLIVTHPGGAHKDDLIATCVLIATHGCSVERRDPTPEELEDAHVAVVDVGGRHDPALHNYDHHQFPREHEPTCALSLVLQRMDLYRDALQFCDWLEPAEWFDSRGPKKTAEWLGVPRAAIGQLNSPVDMSLLRHFASRPRHVPGETVHDFMRVIGEDLLAYLKGVREDIETVRARSERWTVQAGDATIGTVFLPRSDELPREPSNGVARFIRATGIESEIGAMVYPDRRAGGYGISRYEDDPRLDFSRVGGEADVHFAHKSGFMCKTSATDPERLRGLIAGAVVDPAGRDNSTLPSPG